MSAFENVRDLSEDDITRLLLEVVRSHRQRKDPDPSDPSEMQVEDPSDIPSLPSFLAMHVVYTTSPPMLRLAFKMHLTDARDIICILEVLEGWLSGCDTNSGLVLDLANLPIDGGQTSSNNKKHLSTGRSKIPSLATVSVSTLSCLSRVFNTLVVSS